MSKNSSISRTFKYGGIYAEKVFGMVFIITAAYCVMHYLQGGFSSHIGISLMGLFYLGEICLIMLFVIQIINNSRYIPMSISFGSLRKETFIGIQWINFILIVQSVIIFGGYLMLAQRTFLGMESIVILIFALMLICFCGLGQIMAAVSIKLGKLGGFLSAGFLVILITSAIVASLLAEEIGINININDISLSIKILAVFVAVMVYLCGSYINYRVLQNYEVRA